MSKLSANYLSQITQLRRFSAMQTITEQGVNSGYIYLIYSGAVKLFKEIEFRVTDSDETESLVRSPTSKDRWRFEKVFLEEVQQGFIVGAYEFFFKMPMQYSAVCSMPCQVFVFDKYIFEKIDFETLENFKLTLKPYVSDRIIKRSYFHDIKWEIFKKKLVTNIKLQKTIDKKLYLTDRSPIPTPKKDLKFSTIRLPKLPTLRSKTQSKLRSRLKTPTFSTPSQFS